MPRTPRSELVDGLCHVTARGNDRRRIFPTELDCFEYLQLLERELAGGEVACLGYCLMPNHVHLVLDAAQRALSSSVQRLHTRVAMRFRRRYGPSGHVFQGRFGSEPIVDEPHLLEVARYVVLNPVEAGICDHPRFWRWSSYAATLGDAPAPSFLTAGRVLECFGRDERSAREAFRRFVADGITRIRTDRESERRAA